MGCLQRLLQKLLTQPNQIDGDRLFAETTGVVEPFLRGMAVSRWGNNFCYQAQLDALRWSVWNTNTTSFITEYWSVTLKPDTDRFEIKCALHQPIYSSLSTDELEKKLGRAARLGPATRNIPVENILDDNI